MERRLAYVGITRAMDELTLTCARMRMVRGETQYNQVSRLHYFLSGFVKIYRHLIVTLLFSNVQNASLPVLDVAHPVSLCIGQRSRRI